MCIVATRSMLEWSVVAFIVVVLLVQFLPTPAGLSTEGIWRVSEAHAAVKSPRVMPRPGEIWYHDPDSWSCEIGTFLAPSYISEIGEERAKIVAGGAMGIVGAAKGHGLIFKEMYDSKNSYLVAWIQLEVDGLSISFGPGDCFRFWLKSGRYIDTIRMLFAESRRQDQVFDSSRGVVAVSDRAKLYRSPRTGRVGVWLEIPYMSVSRLEDIVGVEFFRSGGESDVVVVDPEGMQERPSDSR